ncbi:MAG: F0F1 ATP synthase subunit epsilon [Kiritimatiellae bacterium]|nr:F0F1 ATP synthase subunit epsilon [Kiritimatiellia bacterium]
MDAFFQVTLIGSSGVVFDGPAEALSAPGGSGSFGVLANHAPMICALTTGILSLRYQGQEQYYLVGNGYLEVCDNRVAVLVSNIRTLETLEAGKQLLKEVNPWKAADRLAEAQSA